MRAPARHRINRRFVPEPYFPVPTGQCYQKVPPSRGGFTQIAVMRQPQSSPCSLQLPLPHPPTDKMSSTFMTATDDADQMELMPGKQCAAPRVALQTAKMARNSQISSTGQVPIDLIRDSQSLPVPKRGSATAFCEPGGESDIAEVGL